MPHCHAALRARGCMRNILHILNHYAISCAPLNITQSLVHLRSSSIISTHFARRQPSCCTLLLDARSTRDVRRHAKSPSSRIRAPICKKAAPQTGEPLQITCSYAAPYGRPRRIDGPSKHEPLCILPEKGGASATITRPYAPIRSTPNSAFTRSNAAAMALSMS